MKAYGLSTPIPVYVTRKTADGDTGSLSCSVWMPILTMLLFFLNAFAWGLIGLYEAVRVFV